MKLALLQTKQNELYNFIDTEKIRSEEEILLLQKEMIEKTFQMAEKAAIQGADMIVTTEAINYAGSPKKYQGNYKKLIYHSQNKILTAFSELAKKYHSYLILDMYYVDQKEKMYNCAFLFNQKGKQQKRYDKVHLAGEEKEYLEAGNKFYVMETKYGNIGICICWDMQFPESARILSLQGADLILCPTWGWEAIYGHSRAYENGVYVAAAMAVPFWMDIEGLRSPSEVISPEGVIISSGNRIGDDIVFAKLDSKKATPYRIARLTERRGECYDKILK